MTRLKEHPVYNAVQALCIRMKLIVNTNQYINSLRKLNKVAIDTKFIALPQIKWYFKIKFTRCTFYSLASVVCDNNSCIIPPLAASVVCFDLFGREQDLSVAYSRERQSPDLTSSNKASLDIAHEKQCCLNVCRKGYNLRFEKVT